MNRPFDLLESTLLDLVYELREAEVRLIIGGGYGLYLKRRYLEATGETHLLPLIPEARSTNDLDMFLATEILADLSKAKAVLAAVQRLGFTAVKDRENFQFLKAFPAGQQSFEVKVDFLTPMPNNPVALGALDIQERRVRNKKSGAYTPTKRKKLLRLKISPFRLSLRACEPLERLLAGRFIFPKLMLTF